jgi:uncharacterized membrane protein
MAEISLAALLWVVSHLGISSTPARRGITAAIGEGPYLLLYSGVAFATLGYLIWTYTQVPRFEYWWLPNPDLYWIAKILMPIAFVLLVGGFMVKNPTMVGVNFSSPDEAPDLAQGVTRITRHPFQWAVILWAGSHMAANGDVVSVIFFGSFLLLSGLGGWLIDRKKARTHANGWSAYAVVTSNIPFAAVLTGRNRLVVRELIAPVGVGLLLYALVYYFHEFITGAVIV